MSDHAAEIGFERGPVGLAEMLSAAQFLRNESDAIATFEIALARLTHDRPYMVAAGLDLVLSTLQSFALRPDELDALRAAEVGGAGAP